MKPKVTSTVPGNEKTVALLQSMWDRVPEAYWEDAYMDIILFGAVRDDTKRKIEKILLNES